MTEIAIIVTEIPDGAARVLKTIEGWTEEEVKMGFNQGCATLPILTVIPMTILEV